jgi:hypothetical protein
MLLNNGLNAIMFALISLSITVSLVMILMLCICRKTKSKSNSSLNIKNTSNLLPLNSIRNSDLSNSLQLIRYNGNNGIEETDNHLRHTKQMTLNRALPDIPSVLSSSSRSTDNEFDLNTESNDSNESQLKNESSGRSSKPRAPQPPNHRSTSGQQMSDMHDLHHPYARIKDNTIDSSTENDTDDYSVPQLCTNTNSNQYSIDDNDMSPPVPLKRFGTNEVNSEAGFSASNAIANRVPSEEIPYMTPPPIRLPNVDTISQSSSDETRANSRKNEISYNTISVREPLAKVLAERANSEHHYNEVEEERVSSFYEEIAGSTASSVTYSKIGDIVINDNNVIPVSSQEQQTINTDSEPPALPSLESLMQAKAESSCSASPQLSINSNDHNSDSVFTNNYPKDLYSSVDKKSKTKSYNRKTIHCVQNLDNEFDNLYAKVQKNTSKDESVFVNQRPSSASEDRCDSVLTESHNSIPPPLPPPLNKSFHPRSSRTFSMYDSNNVVPNPNTSSHQRRYSSENQSFLMNDWRKEQNNDYFNYDSIRNNDIDLEIDPGYEVIKKKNEVKSFQTHPIIIATDIPNGVLSQPLISAVDPGYEAIGFDEYDLEPTYETIPKRVDTNNGIEIVEPGYEVIKRVPQKLPLPHSELNISRNVSDVSSEPEPGYERIRFTQKSDDEIESEPKYASISRTVDFDEDEEEDEHLNERL